MSRDKNRKGYDKECVVAEVPEILPANSVYFGQLQNTAIKRSPTDPKL